MKTEFDMSWNALLPYPHDAECCSIRCTNNVPKNLKSLFHAILDFFCDAKFSLSTMIANVFLIILSGVSGSIQVWFTTFAFYFVLYRIENRQVTRMTIANSNLYLTNRDHNVNSSSTFARSKFLFIVHR